MDKHKKASNNYDLVTVIFNTEITYQHFMFAIHNAECKQHDYTFQNSYTHPQFFIEIDNNDQQILRILVFTVHLS